MYGTIRGIGFIRFSSVVVESFSFNSLFCIDSGTAKIVEAASNYKLFGNFKAYASLICKTESLIITVGLLNLFFYSILSESIN